jgi:hypothetical protein
MTVEVVMKMVIIKRKKEDEIQEPKQYTIKRKIMTVTANYLENLNKNYSEAHNVSWVKIYFLFLHVISNCKTLNV